MCTEYVLINTSVESKSTGFIESIKCIYKLTTTAIYKQLEH